MTTLQELLQQKDAIEQQIAQIKKAERGEALTKARSLVETYEITVEELFGKQRTSSARSAPVKYRNPETGEGWSGRGRAPRWLDGKNREDYAV